MSQDLIDRGFTAWTPPTSDITDTTVWRRVTKTDLGMPTEHVWLRRALGENWSHVWQASRTVNFTIAQFGWSETTDDRTVWVGEVYQDPLTALIAAELLDWGR